MADFSIREAAFTGFRVVRERPVVALWWALLQAVATAAMLVTMSLSAGADFDRINAAFAIGDPKAFTHLLTDTALANRLSIALFPMFVVSLVATALQQAAFARAVLRPSDSAFGYVRFGLAEVRQFGLHALISAIFLGLYLSVFFMIELLAPVLGAQILPIGMTLIVGCAIILGLKLSLASAATLDLGRIDLATSWRLSNGRMNALLGCFLLSCLMAALVFVLSRAALDPLVGMIGSSEPPRIATLRLLLDLRIIVAVPLSALSAALVAPILGTPGAAIYAQLTGRGGAA